MKYSVDKEGYYGEFGGAYIPEILHKCVKDLQDNYLKIIESDKFQKEYRHLLKDYVGRPSPLYFAEKLSKLDDKRGMPMNSAIFCYVLTLFWSAAHFITVKFGFLPNSDVSEIAIVMSYLFYIILYFKVFMLYRKGKIHSAFRGVFVPIMATLGSVFILSGGLQSKLFVFYAAFCILVVLLSFVYYRHRHAEGAALH